MVASSPFRTLGESGRKPGVISFLLCGRLVSFDFPGLKDVEKARIWQALWVLSRPVMLILEQVLNIW